MAHRPVFDVHRYPAHQTVKIGANVTFDCEAKSDAELTFNYYKKTAVGKRNVWFPLDVSFYFCSSPHSESATGYCRQEVRGLLIFIDSARGDQGLVFSVG